MQERTEEVHDVDDGRVGQRLGLMVDEHTSGIKFGMFLTQQVFICDIIPEIVHLFQCDGFHKEGEICVAQYLPLVVVVT